MVSFVESKTPVNSYGFQVMKQILWTFHDGLEDIWFGGINIAPDGSVIKNGVTLSESDRREDLLRLESLVLNTILLLDRGILRCFSIKLPILANC